MSTALSSADNDANTRATAATSAPLPSTGASSSAPPSTALEPVQTTNGPLTTALATDTVDSDPPPSGSSKAFASSSATAKTRAPPSATAGTIPTNSIQGATARTSFNSAVQTNLSPVEETGTAKSAESHTLATASSSTIVPLVLGLLVLIAFIGVAAFFLYKRYVSKQRRSNERYGQGVGFERDDAFAYRHKQTSSKGRSSIVEVELYERMADVRATPPGTRRTSAAQSDLTLA
ncbi:hypothetical protein BJ741DRAFT_586249 [Chytriomyces cf. hyalinus JEL632]|nr:hypothetical protein BJ741DRAFT_586249 [Chytriomyces cf. hyalinus JEL632]